MAHGSQALVLALACLVLPGTWGTSARAEEAPEGRADAPTSQESAARLLLDLDSPFAVEREAAVAALVEGLPGTRAAVLAAFRGAEGRRLGLLARVLAADGAPASLDALLSSLPRTTDPASAAEIRQSLVEHAEQVAEAVQSWRDERGEVPPAVRDLQSLLRRARVEALFVSRKSRTGSTGSYPGQFDVLRPERRLALDVCLAILLDRPMKVPGVFPSGTYRWLRTPGMILEKSELRYMALHAIGELATPEDTDVVDELAALHKSLEEVVERQQRFLAVVEAGLADTILTTLARLRPEPWRMAAELQINTLAQQPSYLDDAAAMLARMGEYRRAVQIYRRLQQRSGEGALISYNLACAYARWAQVTSDPEAAAGHVSSALDALERAHRDGYVDWSWMEQDRDLDAVRGDPRYARLLAAMKAAFETPDPPKPPR